jgi:thiamine biosynthesis lipoprotein
MKFPKKAAKRHWDRRSFLTPKQPSVRTPVSPLHLATGREHWLRLGRQAMATQFEVVLPPSERSRIHDIHRVFEEIDHCESLMTVYRDDSRVSEINRTAHLQPAKVDPILLPVLELSVSIWDRTAGAFDITSGPLTRAWGFFAREGRIPTGSELKEALEKTGSEDLSLNSEAKTIQFSRELEVNLGAIGKGYALDRAGQVLSHSGIRDALMHAGNSSLLAMGSAKGTGSGWSIGIRNPLDPETDIATLTLHDRAMAISGSAEQRFTVDGRRYGHIIDPRTGFPAEKCLNAVAVAATAAEADALSTAFYIMGLEETAAYCDNNIGIGAVLLIREQNTGPVRLHALGLEPDVLEVLCET